MPENELARQLRAARTKRRPLDFGDFVGSSDIEGKVSNGVDGTTADPTWERVASFVADRPVLMLQEGFNVSIPRMEEKDVTLDGSQQTLTLSGDLPEGEVGRQKVQRTGYASLGTIDSIDTQNDEVTITTASAGGTTETIPIFYLDAGAGQMRLRKVSETGDVRQEIDSTQLALAHTRNQTERPLTLSLRDYEAYLPSDWRLDVEIKVPYEFVWTHSATNVENQIASMNLPSKRSQDEIPALAGTVRLDAAGRRV